MKEQKLMEMARTAGLDPEGQSTLYELKHFAQLVAIECVKHIETHRIPVGNSAAGEMACEWTYDALHQIRDNIKEQFDIE